MKKIKYLLIGSLLIIPLLGQASTEECCIAHECNSFNNNDLIPCWGR